MSSLVEPAGLTSCVDLERAEFFDQRTGITRYRDTLTVNCVVQGLLGAVITMRAPIQNVSPSDSLLVANGSIDYYHTNDDSYLNEHA